MRIEYVSVDNLFRESTDEVSATGFIVQPKLSWQADRRLLALEAYYQGSYASYSEDEANYTDHSLGLNSTLDLSSKQRLSARVNLNLSHENQGEDQTANVTERFSQQIETSALVAQLDYTYGAKNALGNLRGGLRLANVGYSNLEQFTDGDDYSSVRPFGIFTLRLSPDTRFLTEIRFDQLDYDDDKRDRNETTLLVGALFSGTGKLDGAIRVGVAKADFDASSASNTTELVSEVGVYFNPVSYSQIGLDFRRSFETLDNINNLVGESTVDRANLTWSHNWSSRLQTVSTLGLTQYDRECPNSDSQTFGGGIEVNLQVKRWLQIGLGANQYSRDQQLCDSAVVGTETNDYDRAEVGVHLRATL